ncbi:MAG: hypothetical protein H7X89_06645 [Rhizobiales bacterium]|nr:hypothetical protein [Hyphomicrobiales bacterium]
MTALFFIGLLFLGGVLWLLLERHESRRAANGKPRHSGLRLIFAAAAGLTVLFSGGCSLLFLSQEAGFAELVLLIGGIPFAVGLLVWWLAMRRPGPARPERE